MKNIFLSVSLMLRDAAAVTSTLSTGRATVKNMTSGYLVPNCKTGKCWTSGWPHRKDLLILGRFFLFLPAGSFSHWVFDAPGVWIILTFLLLTSSFLFDFIFFFQRGGVILRLSHIVCLALSLDCLALYIHTTPMHIPPLSSHTHFPYSYHLHIPRVIYTVKFCCSLHE